MRGLSDLVTLHKWAAVEVDVSGFGELVSIGELARTGWWRFETGPDPNVLVAWFNDGNWSDELLHFIRIHETS